MNRADRFAAGRPSDPTAAVVSAMAEAFEQAAASDPAGTRGEWYRFGGQPLHLRIAGDALHETMAGAFAHLRADSSPGPALTVSLWDGAATGIPCPVRNLSEVFPHTAPFGPSVVASTPDDRVIGYQSHATTTIYDRATRRVIGWVDAADRLSLFERGKPLQSLLFAWQLDEGIAPVHAGLVARGDAASSSGAWGARGRRPPRSCAWPRASSISATTMPGFRPPSEPSPAGSATTCPAGSSPTTLSGSPGSSRTPSAGRRARTSCSCRPRPSQARASPRAWRSSPSRCRA